MKLLKLLPVVVLSSFLLAGCGSNTTAKRPTPTAKPTTVPSPTKVPQINSDQFFAELESKVNLKFSPSRPSSIDWKKGVESENVRSTSIYVQKPKEGDNVALRNYLLSQGFSANQDNTESATFTTTDAYIKENYACLIVNKLGAGGSLNQTKIDCGNLPVPKPTK